MFFKNGSPWPTRILQPILLRRFLAGILGVAVCVVLVICIALPFAVQSSVMAQNADLQAIAHRYPKFTRQQRMALLQARQAQLHPRWRDLSFTQAVARLAMFVAKELPYGVAASAPPAMATFVGNLTQIEVPDNLALIRQSDCSLTLDDFTYQYTFGSSPTGAIASIVTHYDQTLHTEAQLSTAGGTFAKGCADPTLGISTRRAVYLGKTSSGLSMFAGAGYYALNGTNALIYGTGNVASAAVSTFTADTSDPNIIAVTAGDLNGDGMADIVGIDESSSSASVSVYLAHTDGTISASTSYPVIGTTSEAATVDDVNGDGKPDVIVASIDNAGQEYISVLTGKGDGTLNAAVSIKVPTPTYPDGASGGGSTPPVVNHTGTYNIVNVITADLSGSGHKDIITSAGIVLLNNGTGSFTIAPTAAFAAREATSQFGPNLAAGDLNNDGKQDIVLNDGQEVTVYLSNGDGTFTAGAIYSTISDVGYVTVTDLDGDGNADVYIGLANGGYFGGDQFSTGLSYALMGNGDGTLSGAPSLPFIYNGSNIADLNNDGVLDGIGFLGSPYTGTATFTSYIGNKNGTFTQKSTLQISPVTANGVPCYFGSIDSYALGDVNGDGFADIVYIVPDCNSGGFYVATGNGDGTFNTPVFIQSTIPGLGISINSIQVADFNHDGKADLTYLYSAVSTNGTATNEGFAVQLGNGNGTFQPPLVVQTSPTSGSQTATPLTQISAIGDVNGDGYPDLFVVESIPPVCTSQGCGAVTGYTFQLYLGNGDGTFKSPYNMPTNPGFASGLQDPYGQVIIADMNGDGHPDIVALDTLSAGGLAIYLGNGTGTFATPSFINVGGSGATVADFNGDGKLDVAVLSGEFSGIYLGNGDGTLQYLPDSNGYPQPSQNIIFDDFFYPAVTADFNHDGKPGILFASTLLLSQTAAVKTPTLAATSTQLTAMPTTASAGLTITFTATVVETAGTSTPTGTVMFSDGTTAIGTGNLTSGVATFSTAALGVGTHNITAAYGGDAGNAASSSSAITVTVTAAALAGTATTLTASATTVAMGTAITFTAAVKETSGSAAPTGTVTFYDGTTSLGTGTLSSGSATYSTSSLAVGSHSITASYGGDGSNISSTSSAITVTVTVAGVQDFALAVSGASSQSVTPGQSASYSLSVAPLNGSYPGTVTFTASGLPTGATASFSPSSITANGGAQTVAMTIQASVASGMESAPTLFAGRGLRSIAWAILLLPLFEAVRMRSQGRKLVRILFLALLIVGGIVVSSTLSGCGSTNGFLAQAEKSYTVTVTATSGSLQHSAIVTLSVE